MNLKPSNGNFMIKMKKKHNFGLIKANPNSVSVCLWWSPDTLLHHHHQHLYSFTNLMDLEKKIRYVLSWPQGALERTELHFHHSIPHGPKIFDYKSSILLCKVELTSIVKLREREGQRVDLGRSLKGHL